MSKQTNCVLEIPVDDSVLIDVILNKVQCTQLPELRRLSDEFWLNNFERSSSNIAISIRRYCSHRSAQLISEGALPQAHCFCA